MKKKLIVFSMFSSGYAAFILILLCMLGSSYRMWIPIIMAYVAVLFAPLVIYLFFGESGKSLLRRIRGLVFSIKSKNYYKNLRLSENITLNNPNCLTFGDNCFVDNGAAFYPLVSYDGKSYPSKIIIGDNVHIGSYNRFASMTCVEIGDDVLFAAFVHITDHSHEYRDVNLPVNKQGVFTKGAVKIGKGSWLGYRCNILSGVTIGEHCIVAAGAVVTKSVPPYSVVAGIPARVIMRYDFDRREWVRDTSFQHPFVKG
jgi:acetyltransferase-like isoleucine patch superfamily enzyme